MCVCVFLFYFLNNWEQVLTQHLHCIRYFKKSKDNNIYNKIPQVTCENYVCVLFQRETLPTEHSVWELPVNLILHFGGWFIQYCEQLCKPKPTAYPFNPSVYHSGPLWLAFLIYLKQDFTGTPVTPMRVGLTKYYTQLSKNHPAYSHSVKTPKPGTTI